MTQDQRTEAELSCPHILPLLIIADDAKLAAKLSCILQPPPDSYLPVIDGPRLTRPDARNEVAGRNNAAARADVKSIIFAGLSPEAQKSLSGILPDSKTIAIDNDDDIAAFIKIAEIDCPILKWSTTNIGLGLLQALREHKLIEFDDIESNNAHIPSLNGHMIVCEAGEELSEVIAANLAYAMGAGLVIIPKLAQSEVEGILDGYYSLYERSDVSASTRLSQLNTRVRALFDTAQLFGAKSITFITKDLPIGAAFPETPNTHLFLYPDLGIQIINGLAAEQPSTRGVNVAILVDPQTTDAPEIEAAAEILPKQGIFVRAYRSGGAKVRSISEMMDLFPYDFLLFATHCGDAPGYRWTYEFKDTEGIERVLVVDIALGIGQTEDPDILDVTQYLKFHSLDGVDWKDPSKKESLYVGSAIKDFLDLTRAKKLEPTKKENIPRVVGSAAMKMADNNILVVSQSLACGGTPIIVNNACVSWHELASRLMFANARIYIGTLFPVTTTEAHQVILKMISLYNNLALPEALWRAQNDTYGDEHRRPYVIAGVYPQWLRTRRVDAPALILQKLSDALQYWNQAASKPNVNARVKRCADYYEEEIQRMKQNWFDGK